MPISFCVVNLGCAKNSVDGEGLQQVLLSAGYVVAETADRADVVVVNTCGFIQAATDESLAMLADLARRKRQGQLLVAAGCLAERLGPDLPRRVPAIDAVLGTRRWSEVADLVAAAARGERPQYTGVGAPEPRLARAATGATAYLKIADGCSAGCAFCAIPAIKGPYRSRPEDMITAEAVDLAAQGVQELVLIAQDCTAYGRERGQGGSLVGLLKRLLAAVPDVPWLRLMYAYPSHVDDALLTLMAGESRLLPYLDLPLQHAHPEVLRRMRRPAGDPRQLVARIREAVPGIVLRSTFIVGYPGETEGEFATLLRFLDEARLERVGIFPYSAEEGTPAAALADQVPDDVRQRRLDEAMRLQQRISLDRNREQVGKILDVLVEGRAELVEAERQKRGRNGRRRRRLVRGRSYRDAPEVDGLVFFEGNAVAGDMVQIRVTRALPYDLVGDLLP